MICQRGNEDASEEIGAAEKAVTGAHGMVTDVVLQEPTAADYFALGAPQTWVKAAGGMSLVDNDASIRAYAERLIVEPDPLIAMQHMPVLDAMAVKDAICVFFSEETPTPSP
ncbi:hypothetical protein [Rhodopseudomonas sp. B29]|uniref:hypothetical protein n=1 Tax=Rhodopseudomonas sp. B29 TaxID=95607 RepID=UPI000349C622|nr:hypothetical protein [Rhodopseudomonas sp. B29]